MYKSGADNVYIGPGGNGQWNYTTSISNNYQTMTISGTTDLYYKLEGNETKTSKSPFTLQSQDIDVSSVYKAGQQETHSHYNGPHYATIYDIGAEAIFHEGAWWHPVYDSYSISYYVYTP